FPKIHNLERLIDLLSASDNDIMKFKKSYGELSPFAVKSRDPEFNEIDSDYSAEAIKTAEKIKKYVIAQIKKGLI
ncbi:MAG: HEPN domain-containing protein, partial [Promethearchaeota archaeon]